METLAKTVQVLSVVVGVVISVLSFNATREKEAEARRIEAGKPFLQLRQSLYMEAIKSAAILANREGYSPKELAAAKRRFRELYVAELSMVESPDVEAKMVALAQATDRLTTLDSIERNRVMRKTRSAEARARRIREEMVKKSAQEAAARYSPE